MKDREIMLGIMRSEMVMLLQKAKGISRKSLLTMSDDYLATLYDIATDYKAHRKKVN